MSKYMTEDKFKDLKSILLLILDCIEDASGDCGRIHKIDKAEDMIFEIFGVESGTKESDTTR